MKLKYWLSGLVAVAMASVVNAQSFTYQGYLRDGGLPANGTYSIRFRLFNTASGGTALATVGPVSVTVANGLFTRELNFGDVWDGSDRWMEIRVDTTVLSPRVKINPSPYALTAFNALGLQGRQVSNAAPAAGQVLKWNGSAWAPAADLRDAFWQASGTHIFYNTGNVGIGTNNPLHKLHVATDSPDLVAIAGYHTATEGVTYGGVFESNSTNGHGVYASANSLTGTNYGVFGHSISTAGTGVFGFADAGNGSTVGVAGQSLSTGGIGVWGVVTADSGTTYGGRFDNGSTSGTGVFGWAAASSGTIYGVHGQSSSSSGYGVYSTGRFAATGTKSFQIDHPLRPETHYLNHFCTEAPEPLNAYSGNVVTDARGYATVQLPDYFEAINRDFRYQLTVIGTFAQAIIAEKIKHNRFVIRTDQAHVEVSWRVEAIRNDLWVQRHSYQTEQEKKDELKGKYLHPELYDQPKERGIHYQPEPERPTETEKP